MKGAKKKILNIAFLAILTVLLGGFLNSKILAQDPPSPPAPDDDTRPADCGDRCVTISPDGLLLHFWYKSGDKKSGGLSDEKFTYVAISNWAAQGSNAYIYKSAKRPFYIITSDGETVATESLNVYRDYETAKNVHWDTERSWEESNYKLIKGTYSPQYPPTGTDSQGNRYSWRAVINGHVQFKEAAVGGALIQLRLDAQNGPPLGQLECNGDGFFEFSRAGLFGDHDIWLKENPSRRLFLYVRLEKDGKKYQIFEELNFPGDFTAPHRDDKVKFLKDKIINLTAAQEVDDFTLPKSSTLGDYGAPKEGEQSACETFSKCGDARNWLQKTLCQLGCVVYETMGNFVEWALGWLDRISGQSFNPFFVTTAHAQEQDSEPPVTLGNQLRTGPVVAGWTYARGAVNILVVLAMLLIAFANMLRINIDVYEIKKSLPYLILGIILANASLLICRVIVDFAILLSDYFVTELLAQAINQNEQLRSLLHMGEMTPQEVKKSIGTFLVALTTGVSPGTIAGTGLAAGAIGGGGIIATLLYSTTAYLFFCLVPIAGFIFLFLPGLIILALAFLMYIRLYVVWILVMLAPLAFVCMAIPPLQGVFQKWWSWFLKWVFLAPIAYFFIGLAGYLGAVFLGGDPTNQLGLLGRWLLGMAIMVLAIYVPFKAGEGIMAAWGGIGKRLGLAAGLRADQLVAGVTGGYSPRGIYLGGKAALDASRRRYETTAMGRGRVIGETAVATPRAVFHAGKQLWGKGSLKERLGRAKEQLGKGMAGTKEAWQDQMNKQQVDQLLQENVLPYSGERLQEAFSQAVQGNNFTIAAPALVQAAQEGEASQETYAQFQNAFAGDSRANEVVRRAQEASAQSIDGPAVATTEVKNGKVVNRAEGEVRSDANRLFHQAFWGKRFGQRQALANGIAKKLKEELGRMSGAGGINWQMLREDQKEMLTMLRRMRETDEREVPGEAQEIIDRLPQKPATPPPETPPTSPPAEET